MIISINSRRRVMVIRLDIDFEKLVKLILKGRGGKRGGWVLWSLCVFGCISVVVLDGACVRDCRGLGLCTVGTVG
jgi:hypothetical protein